MCIYIQLCTHTHILGVACLWEWVCGSIYLRTRISSSVLSPANVSKRNSACKWLAWHPALPSPGTGPHWGMGSLGALALLPKPSLSPGQPRPEDGGAAACPELSAGRGLNTGLIGPGLGLGLGPGRSPAPAGSTCAGGKATFPPRPFPGGNQSSLLFSMSLRSLPFVPHYLSLPGIRAAPRWLGEGRAVAKISHLKTTMEPFRPARVVPELYFRAGGRELFALLLFSQQNSRASYRRAASGPGPSSWPQGTGQGPPAAGLRGSSTRSSAARLLRHRGLPSLSPLLPRLQLGLSSSKGCNSAGIAGCPVVPSAGPFCYYLFVLREQSLQGGTSHSCSPGSGGGQEASSRVPGAPCRVRTPAGLREEASHSSLRWQPGEVQPRPGKRGLHPPVPADLLLSKFSLKRQRAKMR